MLSYIISINQKKIWVLKMYLTMKQNSEKKQNLNWFHTDLGPPLHSWVFVLKRITFATVTPIIYTTPAFSKSKKWDFWKRCRLRFKFENFGVAFQCKRTKTETFENDGMAAHIRSAYHWRPCKQWHHTRSIRRGVEVISLWHCWGGMKPRFLWLRPSAHLHCLVSCFSFSSW